MNRDTRIQAIAAGVLALCLATSGMLAVNLTAIGGRAKLTYTDKLEEGQSWEMSAGIAMGAFRGIFVNFLWIRANAMKEAGKFYEAIELASAITKLQPRFPRVWVFHAWNMAYNISVTTQTPEERWAWVNAGINLLRDKGIPANPNDMLLHKELGWIFLHKIGGFTDDANNYYKRRLAMEWTVVLGPPPRKTASDRDRDQAIKKYVDWLTPLESAPLSLEACIRDEPGVATLLARIKADVGVTPANDEETMVFLSQYERYKSVAKSSLRAEYERGMGPRTRAFGVIILDPSFDKAWAALNFHLRHRLLVEKYHMDVTRMIRYTQKYGPIDWRHHAAHSLYWGAKGVEAGEARVIALNKGDFDFINTDRIVAQSIQDLFRTGDLYFDYLAAASGREAFFQAVPNPHFVQSYASVLDDMRARSWADNPNTRGFNPLSGGYENFLRDAIVFFYRRGDIRTAEKWRTQLITYPYINLNDPDKRRAQQLELSVFVTTELKDRLTSPSVMINQVTAALMGAFSSGLLAGDDELFRSQFQFATLVHKTYMEEQYRNTPAAGGAPVRMEQLAADFRDLSGGMFYQFMTGLDVDDAQTVYRNAPNDLKLYAYSKIIENFKSGFDQVSANIGLTFEQAFPKPQGYDEFIADITKRMRALQDKNAAKIEQK